MEKLKELIEKWEGEVCNHPTSDMYTKQFIIRLLSDFKALQEGKDEMICSVNNKGEVKSLSYEKRLELLTPNGKQISEMLQSPTIEERLTAIENHLNRAKQEKN